MKKKLTLAALVLAAPAAFSAAASYGASASFTSLGYRLIDLDPYDGVAASVTFKGDDKDLLAVTELGGGGSSLYESIHGPTMGTVSSAQAQSSATALAQLSGGPAWSALAAGSASRGAGLYDGFRAYAGMSVDLVLGAKTAIEWVGSYVLSTWVARGSDPRGSDSAYAGILFGGLENSFQAQAYSSSLLGPAVDTLFGTTTFRIDNTGSNLLNSSAAFIAAAGGGQVGPVPEPSSWLMGLAGLGVLGVVIRRRVPGRESGQPS